MLCQLQCHHIPEGTCPLCLCSLLPFGIFFFLAIPFALLNFYNLFLLLSLIIPSYSMEAYFLVFSLILGIGS